MARQIASGVANNSPIGILAYDDSSATPSVLGLLDGPPSRTSLSGVSVRFAKKWVLVHFAAYRERESRDTYACRER